MMTAVVVVTVVHVWNYSTDSTVPALRLVKMHAVLCEQYVLLDARGRAHGRAEDGLLLSFVSENSHRFSLLERAQGGQERGHREKGRKQAEGTKRRGLLGE